MTLLAQRSQPVELSTHSRAETAPLKVRRLIAPSIFDVVMLLVGLTILVYASDRLINSDGDMPRHLRVGEIIIADRTLPIIDELSHTKHGESFLAFEWGSEVLYAFAYRLAGLPGVVAFAGLIIGATYATVALLMHRKGVHPILMVLALGAGVTIAMVHWLPRPHLISALGAAIVLGILERERPTRPWIMLPVFMVWANLHGAFLWGLALIGLYAFGSGLEWLTTGRSEEWLSHTIHRFQMLLFAVLGSLINPFGIDLHTHVITYLNETYILSITADFSSPNFQETGPQILLAIVLLMFTAFALLRTRPSFPQLLVIIATVAFAMHAIRNFPLFAVTAIPLFVIHIDSFLRRLLSRIGIVHRPVTPHLSAPGLWSIVGIATIFWIAANGTERLPITQAFSNDVFPVAAVQHARENNLQGTMFNEFVWGGYIIHAWPEQLVFIDAQTAFYGEALTREYIQTITLQSGWRDTLDRREIDVVIMPANWPMVVELAREPGWDTWFEDETAVILVRAD